MEKQFLKPQSSKTPEIHFNASTGQLHLTGKSIPENAYEFYKILFDWLTIYIQSPAAYTEMIFRLSYFNSSSTEFILQLIKEMDKLHAFGKDVKVIWVYDEEDEDMEEVGRDFQQMVSVDVELRQSGNFKL
jgi:hypothetical protein